MATIEQRLEALEKKQPAVNINCLLIIMDGDDVTEEQQLQIDEAERIGQRVIIVGFGKPDANRFMREGE